MANIRVAVASLWVACFAMGCGSSSGSAFGTNPNGNDGGSGGTLDGSLLYDGQTFGLGNQDGSPSSGLLTLSPMTSTVTVTNGVATPVTYTAMWNGSPVTANFAVDRVNAGSFVGNVFTPSGVAGGVANVTASYGGYSLKTTLTVMVQVTQNGATAAEQDGGASGAGGNGGVGGSGIGGPVNATTLATLATTPVTDTGTVMLYPYNKTVFPLGVLAPLLQWTPGAHKPYTAVSISIQENYFQYTGTFASTASSFINHPIPQDVWNTMEYSNQGEPVTVSLTFASGTTAYGPLTSTYTIAQGNLRGSVYYNSYDSALANGNGAVLSIKAGSPNPVLISGSAGNASTCYVCHSVSSNGSTMIVNRGDNNYQTSVKVDLLNNNTITNLTPADRRFTWPALYVDGTFAVLGPNPAAIWASAGGPSTVVSMPSGTVITTNNFPSNVYANTGNFSPDGTNFTFMIYNGSVGTLAVTPASIVTMTFNVSTMTFGAPKVIYTSPSTRAAAWPSWLPNNNALVFSLDYPHAYDSSVPYGNTGRTDSGINSELWWIDAQGANAVRMDNLNGLNHLPTGDTKLNFQPNVSPVLSGGYAWISFTTRRAYGNAITSGNPLKKIWVAAIDLNPAVGADPSHPAFYLPGQEFAAGNSRGFWALDPCQADGTGPCTSGDQCCGGYCTSVSGQNVCASTTTTCSQQYDKCTQTADCCLGQGLSCIGGRCSVAAPPVAR